MRVLGAIGLLVGSVTAQTPIDCSSDVDGSGRVGVDDVSTAPCLSPPRSALNMQANSQKKLPWLAVPPNVQRLFRAAAQALVLSLAPLVSRQPRNFRRRVAVLPPRALALTDLAPRSF